MKFLRFAVGLAAAFMLGGCLVSDKPLLDAANARGRPLDAGVYQSCEYEDDVKGDCVVLKVGFENYLYRFEPQEEGEDPVFARFKPIAWKAWLAEMRGEEGEYFYFYAEKRKDALRLVMIQCKDLPGALKDALVVSDDMALEGEETCIAKTIKGAVAAAKAYRGANAVAASAVTVIAKAKG